MSCHQWCECPRCTTFTDSCMNEIKNPHTGTFSESSENKAKSLQAQLDEAVAAIEYVSDSWCIKPECECKLCQFLQQYKKEGV